MYIEKLNASLLGKDDNLVGINPLIMEKMQRFSNYHK